MTKTEDMLYDALKSLLLYQIRYNCVMCGENFHQSEDISEQAHAALLKYEFAKIAEKAHGMIW